MAASVLSVSGVEQRPADIASVHAALASLIGEPLRFLRVSYGDELSLHFGDVVAAASPSPKCRPYGTYILGLRGSAWVLKPANAPLIVSDAAFLADGSVSVGREIKNEDLETGEYIARGARVRSAVPFEVQPIAVLGLELRFTDGSSLQVFPTIDAAEEPTEQELPELADWELFSPLGHLSVGPGLKWAFTPDSEGTRVDSQPGPDAP